jgi:hypothetical protein
MHLHVLAMLLWAGVGHALDYADSAEVRQFPSQDLGNFYSWYDSGSSRLNLLLTLGATTSSDPAAIFERKGKYRIHIDKDNDLKEDLTFDFFFNSANEVAVTTGPDVLRGRVNETLTSDHWQAFAGVVKDPAFGDYAALTQFFSTKFPCAPTAESGLRCGEPAATGTPTNAFVGQNTGLMAVSLNPTSFQIPLSGKINVWASSWVVK